MFEEIRIMDQIVRKIRRFRRKRLREAVKG